MLTPNKLKFIEDLVASSTREDLVWLNGYLSGIITRLSDAPTEENPGNLSKKVTITYGTESGNSKRLAVDFAARAKKKGINAKLVSLDQYRLNDLTREEYFLTVVSTQGDGEPPAAAKKFYDHIHEQGINLEKLQFGVLALGDTAYPLFCKAGEDIDSQLERRGAKRLISLQKCDTDYEPNANEWFAQAMEKIGVAGVVGPKSVTTQKAKKQTYTGNIVTNIRLNDRGSEKHTHHIELIAEGVSYQPGDSIGIIPGSPSHISEAVIAIAGISKNQQFEFRGERVAIHQLLKEKLNIVRLSSRVVNKYAQIVNQEIPDSPMGLHDLLNIYPLKDLKQFSEVLSILEPIPPRLYSISSSPSAHPGEIHLTVARDFFRINNEIKQGLCSNQLADLQVDQPIQFYVHQNHEFKLPAADRNIIMIGPGTGVAPFRSFIAERDATGASGRNWLFFGDRNFSTDFLYQTEIQDWLETGVLAKVTLAFSRDQDQKIYVQHRMLEHGEELYEWIQGGATVYVCGAKDPMCEDVEEALALVIARWGNMTKDAALTSLQQLRSEGRFLKDVY